MEKSKNQLVRRLNYEFVGVWWWFYGEGVRVLVG